MKGVQPRKAAIVLHCDTTQAGASEIAETFLRSEIVSLVEPPQFCSVKKAFILNHFAKAMIDLMSEINQLINFDTKCMQIDSAIAGKAEEAGALT